MRSESSGRVVAKTCKSWLCSSCNTWLREGAKKKIAAGALDRADGYDVALFTFTEPPRATLDMDAFYGRHQRTIQRLRARGWVTQYCTAVEFQKRGALHPHIVAHVPVDVAGKMRVHGQDRRSSDAYRFHFGEMVPLAQELGWGKICDVVAAASFNDLAAYAVKNLSAYTTKQAYNQFKEAGAHRVRPLRSSREWGGRLRELQRGKLCDEGPWQDISQNGPC